MSDKVASSDGQIVSLETAIITVQKKKLTARKNKESQTENQVQTRGHLKQSDMLKWSIFARPEVKIAVQKAAKKAGITDTAWLDKTLWEAATADLSKKPQPPVKTEDVADILRQFTDDMAARQEAAQVAQAATIQAQNDLIQQQGEQIATIADAVKNTQPKSLKEMLFGRKKEG